MSELESAAIKLHDHIWENVGVTDDWPLVMGGDDKVVTEVIRLMNELQDAIKKSGYARRAYSQEGRLP